MNSKKLIKEYSVFNYWRNGLSNNIWHLRRVVALTEEERNTFIEADKMVQKAKELVEAIVGARIGKEIMYEERIK